MVPQTAAATTTQSPEYFRLYHLRNREARIEKMRLRDAQMRQARREYDRLRYHVQGIKR